MGAFHRPFNILRIVVPPSNDKEVLQPSRDKDFAVLDESQVTGSQEGSFACIEKACAEGACRFLSIVPITLRRTRSRQPNFPYLLRRTTGPRVGMRDDHLCVSDGN